MIERSVAEHEKAKSLLQKLDSGNGQTARTLRELRVAIEEHVIEEENELFPKMRASGLDLYGLGTLAAPGRVEALFRQSPNYQMELKEIAAMPVSTAEAKKMFSVGLRNIHGTVRQGRAMVEVQHRRTENYPKLKAKLASHLEEKDAQLGRLEAIMSDMGEQPSAVKDAAGTIMGAASSMMAGMADDEVLKATFTAYGLCNFEAAAYETLIVMAEACRAIQAMQPLQQCLSEERAMAAFIAENLKPTGLRFLEMRSQGREASH